MSSGFFDIVTCVGVGHFKVLHVLPSLLDFCISAGLLFFT